MGAESLIFTLARSITGIQALVLGYTASQPVQLEAEPVASAVAGADNAP